MKTYLDINRYQFERDFPNLELDNHHETSPKSDDYNCYAWAVGENDEKWAPYTGYTWFRGFPKFSLSNPPEEDIDSYKEGFASIGYEECTDGNLEKGFEKIALYGIGKSVKHAARQLENGYWTSKLGDYQDIEHYTVSILEGRGYGQATIFMKRKKAGKFSLMLSKMNKLFGD